MGPSRRSVKQIYERMKRAELEKNELAKETTEIEAEMLSLEKELRQLEEQNMGIDSATVELTQSIANFE